MTNPLDPDDLEGPAPSPEARAANHRAIAGLSSQERFHLMFTGKTEQPKEKVGDASMINPSGVDRSTLTPGAERSNPSPAPTIEFPSEIKYASEELTKPTELDLQLFLAKQLPEEIAENPLYKGVFVWKDERWPACWSVVTPREWDYVTTRVAREKLYRRQKEEFIDMTTTLDLWETRAIALMKLLS